MQHVSFVTALSNTLDRTLQEQYGKKHLQEQEWEHIETQHAPASHVSDRDIAVAPLSHDPTRRRF